MKPLTTSMQLALVGCAALLAAPSAHADDVINVRVSYKIIKNPATGLPPPGVTVAEIDQALAGANDLLKAYQRGYRLVRVGTLQEIGSVGGFNRPDPGYYFGVDFETNGFEINNLDTDAHNRRTMYAWNENAINVFIVPGIGDGFCSNPISSGREVIVLNPGRVADFDVVFHEIGHYFSECHTQGCECSGCPGGGGLCDTVPGDDLVTDTLPDLQCWDRNDISANSFNGRSYNQLLPPEQEQVDNTFLNLMSYHRNDPESHTRQTERQLDRWADWASSVQTAVRDGWTIFVDHLATGFESGRSYSPFSTVAEALAVAGPTDIVLIRPGTYPQNLTISNPVTLRVPRTGTARIGAPP